MRCDWRFYLLLLAVLGSFKGAAEELSAEVLDQLKGLPAEFLQLVEMSDELPSLPRYVNGIRFTTDGRIVLTTWGDPKNRTGTSADGKLTWVPCEGPRKEYDVPGVPQRIDRQGWVWLGKAGWDVFTPYVGTDGKRQEVRKAAGRFRGAPYEDREGRIWLTEDAGVHCWDGQKWRVFRVLPEKWDARDYFITHRLVSSVDGSLLIFPDSIMLREDHAETSHAMRRPKPEEVPGLVFWYIPRGDLDKAACWPLGDCQVYFKAAPLPDGSWLITPAGGTPYPKPQMPFVWRAPGEGATEEGAGKAKQDELRKLVAALDDESFEVRAKAQEQLQREALPYRRVLEAFAKNEERPEVRARLTRILDSWRATSANGNNWRYQGPVGSYSFLAAEGLWTRDPKYVYLAVWQLREGQFAGHPSPFSDITEQLWSRPAVLRYDAQGKVELLCDQLPEARSPEDIRVAFLSANDHEALMPLPRGLLVTAASASRAALLEDGQLVDVSAKLVRVERPRHAAIRMLDRDIEGRLYYKYWDRIRIGVHLMDRRPVGER